MKTTPEANDGCRTLWELPERAQVRGGGVGSVRAYERFNALAGVAEAAVEAAAAQPRGDPRFDAILHGVADVALASAGAQERGSQGRGHKHFTAVLGVAGLAAASSSELLHRARLLPKAVFAEPTRPRGCPPGYYVNSAAMDVWRRATTFDDVCVLQRLYNLGVLGQSLTRSMRSPSDVDVLLPALRRLSAHGDVVVYACQPAVESALRRQRGALHALVRIPHMDWHRLYVTLARQTSLDLIVAGRNLGETKWCAVNRLTGNTLTWTRENITDEWASHALAPQCDARAFTHMERDDVANTLDFVGFDAVKRYKVVDDPAVVAVFVADGMSRNGKFRKQRAARCIEQLDAALREIRASLASLP